VSYVDYKDTTVLQKYICARSETDERKDNRVQSRLTRVLLVPTK
jgi:ribosomal protein S18